MLITNCFDKNLFLRGSPLIICEILSIYNCRVSEILDATWSNFFPDRFLILKGKKKSFDVIVTDRKILAAVGQLPRNHESLIFFPTTYQQIYRILKRNYSHLFTRYKGKHNHKVTHVYRYMNISGVTDRDSAQAILHHRRKSTQDYYRK